MHAEIGGSRRRYRNPPIDEAVCEFRFGSSPDWDLTIPGKLHAALASDYSGKPRNQTVIDVGVEISSGEPANLRYGQGLAKVLLFSADGRRAVGVGADVLSIHMLRPYQGPDSYLHCAVPVVSGLPESMQTYTSRVAYEYEDGTRLVLIHGSISPPSDDVGFLLDIDVIWETADHLTQSESLQRVDVLRDLERKVFETVITDKAREIFDAD